MNEQVTPRGFSRIEFEDVYNATCSIQESSSAMQNNIWLGIDKPKLTIFEDENHGKYIETVMPNNFSVNARMHLSQDMVAKMLPYLKHFVETGEVFHIIKKDNNED